MNGQRFPHPSGVAESRSMGRCPLPRRMHALIVYSSGVLSGRCRSRGCSRSNGYCNLQEEMSMELTKGQFNTYVMQNQGWTFPQVIFVKLGHPVSLSKVHSQNNFIKLLPCWQAGQMTIGFSECALMPDQACWHWFLVWREGSGDSRPGLNLKKDLQS